MSSTDPHTSYKLGWYIRDFGDGSNVPCSLLIVFFFFIAREKGMCVESRWRNKLSDCKKNMKETGNGTGNAQQNIAAVVAEWLSPMAT